MGLRTPTLPPLSPENHTYYVSCKALEAAQPQPLVLQKGAVGQEGAQAKSERSLPASVTGSQGSGFKFLFSGYVPLFILTNG